MEKKEIEIERSESNFRNGKIYQIKSLLDGAQFYYGSTVTSLSKRLTCHKWQATHDPKNMRVYEYFNTHGWINAKIELVENYPCDSLEELLKRERELIDRDMPTLNTAKPFVTEEEKQATLNKNAKKFRESEKGKEYIAQQNQRPEIKAMKQAYADRPETKAKLIEQQKIKRAEYKAKGLTSDGKERKMILMTDPKYNLPEVKQLRDAKFKESQEKYLAKLQEVITCPCGGKYKGSNKRHHFKTVSHLNYNNHL